MGWILTRCFTIESKIIDDETLVFHGGSGETHHLSPIASKVFAIIQNSVCPNSEDELLSKLIDLRIVDFQPQTLRDVLRELSGLNIIEFAK